MKRSSAFVQWLTMLVVVLVVVAGLAVPAGAQIPGMPLGSAASILREKGYQATVHHVVTEDGYVLELVRGSNPLVNAGREGGLPAKEAILFTHGLLTDARCYVANNKGARPRDYSRHNASAMSEQELNKLLADDPSAKSFAFLALNFGHDVWLLSRRGTPISQGYVGRDKSPFLHPFVDLAETAFGNILPPMIDNAIQQSQLELEARLPNKSSQLAESFTSSGLANLIDPVNPRYWNYSLDEVARYDIPNTVEFIKNKTGRAKVSLVGHSAGGAAALMALTVKPELADSLSKILLWAPSLDLGGIERLNVYARLGLIIERYLLRSYNGPCPPIRIAALMQYALGKLCKIEAIRDSLCMLLNDSFFGPSGGREGLELNYLGLFPLPISSHEGFSIIQSIQKGRMHFFDYRDAERNMIAYGQMEPPVYNISRITSRSISIWHGITDTLVPPFTIDKIKEDLAVPVEVRFINESTWFNHFGFIDHKNITQLLNIPALRTLESAAE